MIPVCLLDIIDQYRKFVTLAEELANKEIPVEMRADKIWEERKDKHIKNMMRLYGILLRIIADTSKETQ